MTLQRIRHPHQRGDPLDQPTREQLLLDPVNGDSLRRRDLLESGLLIERNGMAGEECHILPISLSHQATRLLHVRGNISLIASALQYLATNLKKAFVQST